MRKVSQSNPQPLITYHRVGLDRRVRLRVAVDVKVDDQNVCHAAALRPLVLGAGQRLAQGARDRRKEELDKVDQPLEVHVRVGLLLCLCAPPQREEDRNDRDEDERLDHQRRLEASKNAGGAREHDPKVEGQPVEAVHDSFENRWKGLGALGLSVVGGDQRERLARVDELQGRQMKVRVRG